jgi:FtsH-binding integral membrane protein
MADYNNRVRTAGTAIPAVDEGLRAYMLRVYNYMLMGLALTGLAAFATANTPLVNLFFSYNEQAGAFGPNLLGWVAIIAPVALVFFLSFRVHKMSFATAQMTFWVYAGLMGISIASILLNFTGASVARVFFITAATFGAMSLYGYTTKRDLTGWGSFLFMGLIGLIIASVVNIFLASTMLHWVVSVAGVLIFTGLTAYDTQRIKMSYDVGMSGEAAGKMAIMGALSLYLDFINLFIMLMRIMGERR